MQPILKWAGGKRSELPVLRPHFPQVITRLVEPFAGGAAVAWDVQAPVTVLNDLNPGLIAFYRMLKNPLVRRSTRRALETIETVRARIRSTFHRMDEQEVDAFYCDPRPLVSKGVQEWTQGLSLPPAVAVWELLAIQRAQDKVLTRIPDIERNRGEGFSFQERREHAQTAIQSSWYELLREIHNGLHAVDLGWSNAAWWSVRTLCYSGMFRYSAKGIMNVPYGGRAYNARCLTPAIHDVFDERRLAFMRQTVVEALDFEALFRRYDFFAPDDFVFVDPPYDSAFSKYNPEGDFTRVDQQRLANTLALCNAPWMLVIKSTEFIKRLYQEMGAHGYAFEKEYAVNFRNRHVRDVTHLVITKKPLRLSSGHELRPWFNADPD